MKIYTDLLFDADGTLLDFQAAERGALRAALAAQKIVMREEMLAVYSDINAAIWREIEAGTFDRAHLNAVRFSRLDEHFSLNCHILKLGEDYMAALAGQGQLIDGALALCTALSARYRLSIVTNGTASVQHGRLDGSPLRALFDGLFISQELGAEKPSPAFFDAVEKGLPGFCRERALVIGDSLSSDMAGGIAAGIDTCWYNPTGKRAPDGMALTYTVPNYAALHRLLLD